MVVTIIHGHTHTHIDSSTVENIKETNILHLTKKPAHAFTRSQTIFLIYRELSTQLLSSYNRPKRRQLFPVIVGGSNFLDWYNYYDRDSSSWLLCFKALTRLLNLPAFLYEKSSNPPLQSSPPGLHISVRRLSAVILKMYYSMVLDLLSMSQKTIG